MSSSPALTSPRTRLNIRDGDCAAQGHSVGVGRADPDPGLLALSAAWFSPLWEMERRETVMDKPRHIQSSARVRQVHKELAGAAVKDKAQEELEARGKEDDDVRLEASKESDSSGSWSLSPLCSRASEPLIPVWCWDSACLALYPTPASCCHRKVMPTSKPPQYPKA